MQAAIQCTKNLHFSSDFGRVAYDLYEPAQVDSNPIIIQIAHGMIEHKDRYEWVANTLAQKGYMSNRAMWQPWQP